MRLVFILYAEDRGLMPASDVYQRHYSVAGLFERLRDDEARYPDTMDARYGAWAQLLALFRLIHDGGGHGAQFPARHGGCSIPTPTRFSKAGRTVARRVQGERVDPPRISDGVVFRVLQNLLILDGERLSYRALDVEQIGSVYEAMMGFALEQAPGPSIAVAPKHIVVNLDELLGAAGRDRAKWLRKEAELKLRGRRAREGADRWTRCGGARQEGVALHAARAAGGRAVSAADRRAPPLRLPLHAALADRSRSSRTTLRPILERLGEQRRPSRFWT